MPCFKLFTNLSKNNIPSDFTGKLTSLLARAVRKPSANFICVISNDCSLSFGGESTSPGAVAVLESIGHISAEDNKLVTQEVTEFVEKELGINPNRFFISFYDVQADNIGIGGIILSEFYKLK